MPRFKVAHVKEQGVDLIIIPLGSGFGSLSNSAQNAQQQELQIRANASGLAGTVVPVWEEANDRMGFSNRLPPHHAPIANTSLNINSILPSR